MAIATFNPSAGEGRAFASNASWSTARGAATASGTDTLVLDQADLSGSYVVGRGFLPFDTSSLGAGATITGATLQLYRDDAPIGGFFNNDSTTTVIVQTTQASGTALASSDYSLITFSSKGSITNSSTSNLSYSTITITDLSVINKTGYTKIAIISGRDLSNTTPTGRNTVNFQKRTDANPAILTITYTTATNSAMLAFF